MQRANNKNTPFAPKTLPTLHFTVRGHPNVRATHPTTIEFSRDTELSARGDCIVGVAADFTEHDVRAFIERTARAQMGVQITVTIDIAGQGSDQFTATLNLAFRSANEMVLRMSEYTSDRTIGIRATKAAAQLDRNLIAALRNPACIARIAITAQA